MEKLKVLIYYIDAIKLHITEVAPACHLNKYEEKKPILLQNHSISMLNCILPLKYLFIIKSHLELKMDAFI